MFCFIPLSIYKLVSFIFQCIVIIKKTNWFVVQVDLLFAALMTSYLPIGTNELGIPHSQKLASAFQNKVDTALCNISLPVICHLDHFHSLILILFI